MNREDVDVTNVDELPPEVLSQVLGILPQKELAENRSVCSYWRDVIDKYCTMEVKIQDTYVHPYRNTNGQLVHSHYKKDKFLERKLELRMRDCRIDISDDQNPKNINLAHPQSIRSLKVESIHVQDLRRLLIQVKPNVQVLFLPPRPFKDVLSPTLTFPRLRELRIEEEDPDVTINFKLHLDSLFVHSFPLLTSLHLSVGFYCWFLKDGRNIDETYQAFFKFLSSKKLKELTGAVGVRYRYGYHPFAETTAFPGPFELPDEVWSLLSSGHMQLDVLHLLIFPRYTSPWTRFIQTQSNLTQLKVECGSGWNVGHFVGIGIPFHLLVPGIQGSIGTLRKVNIQDIKSVTPDGLTWISLDCSVFKDAINLEELKLHSIGSFHLNEEEVEESAINLGDIPTRSLKVLKIERIFCESVDLQRLVDSAHKLEHLTLSRVQNPTSISTGVHGGIVQSFVQKPNKKWIHVGYINLSNPDQNAKFEAVKLEFPPSFMWHNGYFHSFKQSGASSLMEGIKVHSSTST